MGRRGWRELGEGEVAGGSGFIVRVFYNFFILSRRRGSRSKRGDNKREEQQSRRRSSIHVDEGRREGRGEDGMKK